MQRSMSATKLLLPRCNCFKNSWPVLLCKPGYLCSCMRSSSCQSGQIHFAPIFIPSCLMFLDNICNILIPTTNQHSRFFALGLVLVSQCLFAFVHQHQPHTPSIYLPGCHNFLGRCAWGQGPCIVNFEAL